MTKRISKILALIIVAVLMSGCEEALGPLFSIDVDIHGPARMVGQWAEAEYWDDVPAGYRCEPVLVLYARGGSSDRYRSVIWTDMVIRHYDASGAERGAPQVYTGTAVERYLPYLTPGNRAESRRIPVVADTLPFRWTLEARYYDPDTGSSRKATFSSRCDSI